jgi:hypothetical protein
MRIKLSVLRRIIKEEAARFITESSAYDTFVADVLGAKETGEDYRSLPSAEAVVDAWMAEQVSAEELVALLSDAGISEDEAVNIVGVILPEGAFDDSEYPEGAFDDSEYPEVAHGPVPSECPDCREPLTAGEDGSVSCSKCGWSEDADRPMDYL